ncbi:hypothetical protein MMC28_009072 [Mycoblastus sanguinarius]|nr:hypothetical protein [Mycoblastus sanguinarius]
MHHGKKDEDEDEGTLTDQQEESYSEFTKAVYESLLRDAERREFEHEISFGAQDDAWAKCWRERTGIPLGDYKERWRQLQDWPADATLHLGDPLNRDPHITDEQLAEFVRLRNEDKGKNADAGMMGSGISLALGELDATSNVLGKRKASGLYGGTTRGLISMVSRLGEDYLSSYRGNDDTGDDGALHSYIRLIQTGDITNQDDIEETLRAINYRMDQMAAADRYTMITGFPAPKELQCCEYDTNNIKTEVGEKYRRILALIYDRPNIFPKPIESQGRTFSKGHYYLIAAFPHANLFKDAIIKRLDFLAARLDADLEQQKEEFVKKDPEVRSKRQKLYHSFGIAVANMSPKKQRSRGGSVIGSTSTREV